MKQECNKNRVGLSLGIFFVIIHGLWIIIVGAGWAQDLINWMLRLHFVENPHTLLPFNIVTGIIGLITAFIMGYITGWIFVYIYNWTAKL